MAVDRWQMNRAGIFNFWYYDDQEFQLEEGRLILRGANGSGKSVTMQSFLPLVLDGDKRPHRLDPFGSRDRRIEYYLLGDAESDITDRTGYLWMEFIHPGKQLYKTIGIGLRARRGTPRVAFWGFLLDDGRRINVDFWLYDRILWLEQKVKQPLSRRVLEEKIGSGGQVVQEQAVYRDMVNKALFGFHDSEAFQDLLQLMVQLRSPKLSKDFKPSSIYEILTQALPPLLEEELRPLSEVLEDMDQIADRLDEIALHRREMVKLQAAYDKYNRFLLFEHANRLIDCSHVFDQFQAKVDNTSRERKQAVEEKEQAEQRLTEVEYRLQEIDAELEVLHKHEAINKQHELEIAQTRLDETNQHLKMARERISQRQRRLNKLQQEHAETTRQMEIWLAEQYDQLAHLEELAREAEFAEHDVYHRYWHQEIPEDDRWRGPWRRDLAAHRQAVEMALKTAQAERELARQVQEIERELGDARKERDLAERERVEAEQLIEIEKESLREQLVEWKQGLRILAVSDEVLRESLRALTELDAEKRDYSPVRQPAVQGYEQKRQEILERRMALLQKRKQTEEEREQLKREKEAWESSREPEPKRSEARSKARASRPDGTGAPLYEVCEFAPELDDEKKARVEEALERAGLLDAWITPDGRVGRLQEDEEEVWLIPAPQSLGYTLADALIPTPSPESGLKVETIDAVLRTFLWEETEGTEPPDWSETGERAVLSAGGGFRIGPLTGISAKKERAEYIGKETRRRTRLLEINRLQNEIAACDEQLRVLDAQLAELKVEEMEIRAELERFPADETLQRAFERFLKAMYRLEELLKQEERIHKRFKEKKAIWRNLQQELAERTAGWTRIKREKDLQDAVRLCHIYESMISELHSIWRRYRDATQGITRLQEEEAEVKEAIETDEILQEELEEQRRGLKAQVERLNRLIEELGISDLNAQIRQLKEERKHLIQQGKKVREEKENASARVERLTERLNQHQEELKHRAAQLELAFNRWHHEMGRALVSDWREAYRPDGKKEESLRLCKEISRTYANTLGNRTRESVTNSLLDEFNTVRHILADYALEAIDEEETGRIIIVSMRDRTNPQPPSVLLDELSLWEEEQRSLLSEKDRELYEEIILRSVGKAIRHRIQRAEQWVRQMNRMMAERNTSSGLRLKLEWVPKPAQNEQQLDTETLVHLLKRDAHRLHEAEIEKIITHFRSYIAYAKQEAQEERDSLRKYIYEILDYRHWFQFVLYHRKGEQAGYRELTDSKFNVLSGGEKAMAMYIPLFAAMFSRYTDARNDAPKIISLDEAFAGVDEENMRDMFKLLTEMGFDYMMTSQVLWGCYDTVPSLAIYEIYRPKNVDFVTLFRYRWNGRYREYVEDNEHELQLEQSEYGI